MHVKSLQLAVIIGIIITTMTIFDGRTVFHRTE
jgi:hypothetical protein